MAYVKNSWNTGDTITAEKLNHMENGIKDAENTAVTIDFNLASFAIQMKGPAFTDIYSSLTSETPVSFYAILSYRDTSTQKEWKVMEHIANVTYGTETDDDYFAVDITIDASGTEQTIAFTVSRSGNTHMVAEGGMDVWFVWSYDESTGVYTFTQGGNEG